MEGGWKAGRMNEARYVKRTYARVSNSEQIWRLASPPRGSAEATSVRGRIPTIATPNKKAPELDP